jgi:hypothetical protein
VLPFLSEEINPKVKTDLCLLRQLAAVDKGAKET